MKILRCTFVSHLLLNSATYGWKKEDDFWIPVWFKGNALPSAKELTAISLGSVKIDNQELDIVAENESDIKHSQDKECILLGDEPGFHSDID